MLCVLIRIASRGDSNEYTQHSFLKNKAPKRYPTIISIVPPGVALIVLTFRGSNYAVSEQIFMVPKGFEPSKFDCKLHQLHCNLCAAQIKGLVLFADKEDIDQPAESHNLMIVAVILDTREHIAEQRSL